jgi:hypothetical protein
MHNNFTTVPLINMDIQTEFRVEKLSNGFWSYEMFDAQRCLASETTKAYHHNFHLITKRPRQQKTRIFVVGEESPILGPRAI